LGKIATPLKRMTHFGLNPEVQKTSKNGPGQQGVPSRRHSIGDQQKKVPKHLIPHANPTRHF